ncbi:Histone-lysine N-methyltransferase KMT5C [Galemys pyrenaicus]|uniref:Histone-lysine N-methyltransferase KMT5C n=1 Tax=Galemys pyrenaicus TaxID=202257 RepID=A0A8J6AKS7_GALPY|nr:Histone-lysine N-methyltransferase KMT5C [Galemys pyrenaicus]
MLSGASVPCASQRVDEALPQLRSAPASPSQKPRRSPDPHPSPPSPHASTIPSAPLQGPQAPSQNPPRNPLLHTKTPPDSVPPNPVPPTPCSCAAPQPQGRSSRPLLSWPPTWGSLRGGLHFLAEEATLPGPASGGAPRLAGAPRLQYLGCSRSTAAAEVRRGAPPRPPPPEHPSLPPLCRKGEGAFRQRPREPPPPGPLDKYELRETKRRLLQGLPGARACAHLSALRWDPFCASCRPLRGARPPTAPLWLQWPPTQTPLRSRPRKRRRPPPRRAPPPPELPAVRISLHRWGGCGPHCCLRAEARVALGKAPSARWAPQQDWHWARRYGLPSVVRVDLSRAAPAPPTAALRPGAPGPLPLPKQALPFAPFSPPKRLRLVVSHGSIDLDINSDGP